jgi:hypothetical protein
VVVARNTLATRMHAEQKLLLKVFNMSRCAPETVCVVHMRGADGEFVHDARACPKCVRMLWRSGVRRVLCTRNERAEGAQYNLLRF